MSAQPITSKWNLRSISYMYPVYGRIRSQIFGADTRGVTDLGYSIWQDAEYNGPLWPECLYAEPPYHPIVTINWITPEQYLWL